MWVKADIDRVAVRHFMSTRPRTKTWWTFLGSTPEELQCSIVEMLRRRYGDIELSPDVVQAEMIEVMGQTLDNLYRALDAKAAIIVRLTERLRELGQGGLQDEVVVPH